MSDIVFRGAWIRYADLRHKEEMGCFARLHFTADCSSSVIEALGWEPIPDCIESAKLPGELISDNLVLTPNRQELRQHEIQMGCSEVGEFQLFRIKGEDGGSTRTELRFIARVCEVGAIARIENYMRLVGSSVKSSGSLKISYAMQEVLPLDGDDKVHASDRRRLKKLAELVTGPKEAPLASAREATGGTHQRKRKGVSAPV